MSWLFSQALVEAYSEGISLDGEQSVQSSGNPTPQAYLCSDKMMGFSRLSRFGMTFRLLTENRGEALLMSYLEVFPVRTFPQQEKAQALTESDQVCGEKWQGSFAKYDPDTHSLRTHQCSLLEDSTESCQTLPAWGLMRDGECWEQPTLALRIRGTESGSWPTPVSSETSMGNTKYKQGGTPLSYAVQYWPTPLASDGTKNGSDSLARAVQPELQKTFRKNAKQTWTTPTAHMAKEGGFPSEHERNTPTLSAQAGGKLNPNWVEWLMNWPIKWSDINEFNPKEFERWKKKSSASLQESGLLRTMWWDRDPSQAPFRPQHDEQQSRQHSDSLSEMSWIDPRKREMERSHQGQNVPVLRQNIHIQTTEGKDLQQGMWQQIGMDEAQIVPRVAKNITARVDRLKAIGNGQVPAVAATAFRLLSENIRGSQ
jgi:hypothetical protein